LWADEVRMYECRMLCMSSWRMRAANVCSSSLCCNRVYVCRMCRPFPCG
jgi:hypothetical protein